MAENTGIVKVAESVKRLAEVSRDDLASVEAVTSLVEVVSEANDLAKAASDAKALAVRKVKSLYEGEAFDGHSVTLYNFELGKKVCLEVIGGAATVDADGVLAGLYRLYDEEFGSTDGKAWAAWEAMTVPRRELDETRVLAFIADNPDVARVVERSTTVAERSHKLVVRNVTKAERHENEVGSMSDGEYVR